MNVTQINIFLILFFLYLLYVCVNKVKEHGKKRRKKAKAKAKNHPAVAPLPQIPAGKDFFQN